MWRVQGKMSSGQNKKTEEGKQLPGKTSQKGKGGSRRQKELAIRTAKD